MPRTGDRQPIAERFAAKWRPDPKTGCWIWVGGLGSPGYGSINEGGRKGRQLRAHRVSYEIHIGPIPDGLCVCHRCDQPKCVNPAHLFLGTNNDNVADRHAKGRDASGNNSGMRMHYEARSRGEKNGGGGKLTESAVREIRRRAAGGETGTALAREFGVNKVTTCAIIRGKLWRHV